MMVLGWIALVCTAIAIVVLVGHFRRWWQPNSLGGALTAAACLVAGAANLGLAMEFASIPEHNLFILEGILGGILCHVVFLVLAGIAGGPWYFTRMVHELEGSDSGPSAGGARHARREPGAAV